MLRRLFQLDPISLNANHAQGEPSEISCLQVETLTGALPVADLAEGEFPEGSHGRSVLRISRPRIADTPLEDHSAPWQAARYALVEVAFNCGMLCGGGHLYYLAWADGHWRVV